MVNCLASFCRIKSCLGVFYLALQWRHNEREGVSDYKPRYCLLNRVIRRRSKKTPNHRFTGLCARNSPVTGEFRAQKTSNAENVPIWWCILWQISQVGDTLSMRSLEISIDLFHQELPRPYSLYYSISQEICTRFLLCCALLWLYIDWFSHIHQAYFTDTVAI